MTILGVDPASLVVSAIITYFTYQAVAPEPEVFRKSCQEVYPPEEMMSERETLVPEFCDTLQKKDGSYLN